MRFAARVSAGVVVLLVLVIGLALFASPGRAAAETTVETGEPVETVTTELEPGWNLAGWTEPAAPVETIFESIPELRVVYSWDADFQRFRLAMRADPDDLGDLGRLTPGMGLWLFLAGDEPVTWTRPIVSEAGAASLREGWNVVLWAGEDGSAARDALVDIDDILADAFDVDGREPLQLRKGQVYWLNLTGSREWNQVYLPPRIEFLADFSQEEQVEVRAHVDDVVAYFSQRLGIRVSGLTVRYPDPDPYPCGGYYHDSVITVGNCLDVFAHEYVHAIQDYMAEGASTHRDGSARVTLSSGQLSTPMQGGRETMFDTCTSWLSPRRAPRVSCIQDPSTTATTCALMRWSNGKGPMRSTSSYGR